MGIGEVIDVYYMEMRMPLEYSIYIFQAYKCHLFRLLINLLGKDFLFTKIEFYFNFIS